MVKNKVGITAALCLLAIILGIGLAMPSIASPKPSQAKEWIETWRCEVFAWTEYNGTYYARCTNGPNEYNIEIDKSLVKRNTTDRAYIETYHIKTDVYGTTSIVYISKELRLDE